MQGSSIGLRIHNVQTSQPNTHVHLHRPHQLHPAGLQNIHESPHRAAAFKTAAKKAGVKVRDIFWTLGSYDGVLLFDAESDKAATSATLALSSLGNVHTQTLRTFSAAEFADIVKMAPRL